MSEVQKRLLMIFIDVDEKQKNRFTREYLVGESEEREIQQHSVSINRAEL